MPTNRKSRSPKTAGLVSWKKELSDRLRLVQEQSAGSQAAFAKSCGIPQSSITAWYRRTSLPSCEALHRIGEVTGVGVDWLLFGPGVKPALSRLTTRTKGELELDVELEIRRRANAEEPGSGNMVRKSGADVINAAAKDVVEEFRAIAPAKRESEDAIKRAASTLDRALGQDAAPEALEALESLRRLAQRRFLADDVNARRLLRTARVALEALNTTEGWVAPKEPRRADGRR